MKIIICDDDKAHQNQCSERLKEIARDQDIELSISFASSGKELLFFMETKFADTDLIFMDYHMDGMNGIETARQLRDMRYVGDIVFYTVDSSHAIEAFDVDAFHYIVKNETSDEQFRKIILRAMEKNREQNAEYISFTCAGEHRTIAVQDICYFEVQNRIVNVHYFENGEEKTFEFYSTLSKIEELLFDKGFERIHSSYVISKKYVKRYNSKFIEMNTGVELPIGRSYRGKTKELFE